MFDWRWRNKNVNVGCFTVSDFQFTRHEKYHDRQQNFPIFIDASHFFNHSLSSRDVIDVIRRRKFRSLRETTSRWFLKFSTIFFLVFISELIKFTQKCFFYNFYTLFICGGLAEERKVKKRLQCREIRILMFCTTMLCYHVLIYRRCWLETTRRFSTKICLAKNKTLNVFHAGGNVSVVAVWGWKILWRLEYKTEQNMSIVWKTSAFKNHVTLRPAIKNIIKRINFRFMNISMLFSNSPREETQKERMRSRNSNFPAHVFVI